MHIEKLSCTLAPIPEAAMNPKTIVIDGKSYGSVSEMPPDVRAKYEQAMSSLQGGKIMDSPGG